ncbi:hypothetical protein AMS69_01550 [Haloarcula rubripromontorii]|uniref:Uncharacterized protein n=1 Tax=Haloarcula rubripromontorii TaxID=1705562 RepID=A0A0M9ALS5_9EURY|nr:hypothetical protein [Haloarcula rubripromontorii]KOX94572.1 hypothetical protein AMS69_01550 [Haloarcula rubripromontorii]
MGLLTILGLLLDIFGAILILGPEYRPLEKLIRSLDPMYTGVNYGLKKIESREGGETQVKGWKFYPMRWFINNFYDEKITSNDTVVFASDRIYWDAEQMEYWITEQPNGSANMTTPSPSERDDDDDYDSQSLKIRHVRNRYKKVERKWMYKLGLMLLISGFLLQLIDQITCCSTVVGNQPT